MRRRSIHPQAGAQLRKGDAWSITYVLMQFLTLEIVGQGGRKFRYRGCLDRRFGYRIMT